MKLNSKITGGLAWAGLVLILAVPSADLLTRPQDAQRASSLTSGNVDAVETSSVKLPVTVAPLSAGDAQTAERTAAVGADPVENYLESGKRLPSYISDAPAPARVTVPSAPAAVATTPRSNTPAATAPTSVATTGAPGTGQVKADGTFGNTVEVAALPPQAAPVAPVPYPASMRPRPVTAISSTAQQPLILDEEAVLQREAAIRPPAPLGSETVVGREELEEWNSGSLADYLERRGLLSDANRSYDSREQAYEDDEFFLSDRREPDRRLIGPARGGFFFY
jgi:hypothetical protein